MQPLVTVDWLRKNLESPNLILLDASLPATAEGKSAKTGLVTIPGARFFDLKQKFSDKTAPFPNTPPSSVQFEKESQALGINQNSIIIVFDNMGVYSSPRVWWMYKLMGHEQVYVLDGGLPQWIKAGLEVQTPETTSYIPGNFKATYQSESLKSYEEVLENLDLRQFLVVDARSNGRFEGTAPDPRKHLKSGHIPGSVNLPYTEVLDQGKLKSPQALAALFQAKTGKASQLVFSCGSGLTACIIMLASHIAGRESMLLYDGSWTEWAELQGLTLTDNQ